MTLDLANNFVVILKVNNSVPFNFLEKKREAHTVVGPKL